MSSKDTPDATLSAEQAINTILEAEQRSREVILQRRVEAQEIVASARERARRIHARADTRSVAARHRCQRAAATRVAELHERADRVRSRPVQPDPDQERLAQAIATLAAELTGGQT